MKTKDIKVDEDVWWSLSKIKVNKKLKSISKVIEQLVQKHSDKEDRK